MDPRYRRAALALLGLVGLVAAAFLAARWLFDEPGATPVESLTEQLGAERVLAVFAHPDDEMLITEVLRQANEEEAYTAVVTATRGERGDQMPMVARQQDLAVVRHAEVLKHGFALGVDAQDVWALPDGRLDDLPPTRLVDSVTAALRRHRPELVITFWPASGISMHPDHMAIGAAVEAALRRLRSEAENGAPRWIAYPLLPRRALHRLGGERGRTVAANQPPPTHTVPIHAGTKRRGWRIHASQHHYTGETYGLPAWLLYTLWDSEHYTVTEVGSRPRAVVSRRASPKGEDHRRGTRSERP